MIVDAVDDAVKAAASAFNNGIVKGCNTSLISCIIAIAYFHTLTKDNLRWKVASIMARGFIEVQKRVLTNAFPEVSQKRFNIEEIDSDDFRNVFKDTFGIDFKSVFDRETPIDIIKHITEIYDPIYDDMNEVRFDVYDIVAGYAIYKDEVFDVTTKQYTDSVVNSVETDIEIMKSVSDLISILINGNQMVVATYGGVNNQ